MLFLSSRCVATSKKQSNEKAISSSPTLPKTFARYRFSGRMYDVFAGAKRDPKKMDDMDKIRVTKEQIEKVRRATQKHGPEPQPNTTPMPFTPYYRREGKQNTQDANRPMYYEFTKPYSPNELASNPEAYKTWQDQLKDRKELDRRWMGGRQGMAADPKMIGSMYEVHPGRFRKTDTETVKKELDPSLNMKDHGFETDSVTGHFTLNGTRVPQQFDHWIEEPGTVKTSRDLKLLKKIERSREREAAKHRLKMMGPTQRSDMQLDKRHEVTRRMIRVGALIQEEIDKAIDALPSYLATHSITLKGKRSVKGQALAETMIVNSGAVEFVKVEMSKDLLHAKIFWTAPEQQVPLVERELDRSTPALRHLVTQAVQLKYSPELTFVRETASQLQQETNEIMKKVEFAVKAFDTSADSPYLPNETPPRDSTKFIDVKVAHRPTLDAVNIPFQDKLIRSRWTARATQPPPHLNYTPPK
jgi:ribosome-binding factor A